MTHFNVLKTDTNIVIKLLKEEQKLRYSDQVQKMYDDGLNQKGDPEYIEKWIQRKVLKNNGFTPNDLSMSNYQAIGHYFKDNSDVKDAVQYLRINIMKACHLNIGDHYIDCNIVTLNGQKHRLSQHYDQNKPFVILAGSLT